MSLLNRALLARLAAASPLGSNAALPQLGLVALQQQLNGGLQQLQTAGWWVQTRRGFSTPGGGSGGSGGGSPQVEAEQQPKAGPESQSGQEQQLPEVQPQQEKGREEEQQQQQDARLAAQGLAPEQQQQQQQEAPPAAEGPQQRVEHPELAKYIAQLKELKGSTKVQVQEVGGEASWWQDLLGGTLGTWLQGWIGRFMTTRVEKDFETEEFLEGAKDAFHTVHKLLAEEDWASLKTMMSAKLLHAFKDTAETYHENGLVWRTVLSGGVEAGLRGIGFASKQQMAAYDEEQAALAPDDWRLMARPSGMWLVLTVQLKAEQNVTISRKEDGQIVAQVRDLRPLRWRFATGPLPNDLPVHQLDTQWFLLSI